jgi:nucleotide-binding universal stress UspA family protein
LIRTTNRRGEGAATETEKKSSSKGIIFGMENIMLPFKKIVCPIDFSDMSYEALQSAERLARHDEAELLLVHIITFPAPNDKGFTTEAEAFAFAREAAEEKLQHIIATRLNHLKTTRIIIRSGSPAGHFIIDLAREEGADLIVIGTHGLTGWRRLVLGSVTEEVMRLAQCPILTVRSCRSESATDQPYQKILSPIDFSAPSLVALGKAGELAAGWDAALSVLHVMEPMAPAVPVVGLAEKRETEAAQKLSMVIEKHLPEPLWEAAESRRLLRSGRPGEEIVRVAEDDAFDLIVIATQGRTGWRHLFFGSVAGEVVRIAPCPVLVVGPAQTTRTAAEPAAA